MNKLFGIPTTNIMWVLVAIFALCVAAVAAIALSNRTMFRMGLRNIPRRGTQTALVVLGLMLSTLIITASFTTGDTLDYSFTKTTYDTLQRTDLRLDFGGGAGDATRGYAREGLVTTLESRFQGDSDIDGFIPLLRETLPALNPRTRLSEPNVTLTGIDPVRQQRFGGLRLVDGGKADLASLGENQALVSKTTADKLDVKNGDTITFFAQDKEWPLQVAGIVANEVGSGISISGAPNEAGGVAVPASAAQRITGHPGQINWMGVALRGNVRGSEQRTDTAAPRLESYLHSAEGKSAIGLGDLDVKVDPVKQDAVKQAEVFGNIFTTFFLVLGLFSIAAGILLIFMIFVMLAAERKTEMGMARAVGAQRRNLIQMFVSEGMSYNVMAGAVGAVLGVAAAFALVVVGLKVVLGGEGNFLAAHVTPRSLVISYCLGVVLTFITVVISSMRVSRLNIVAAIRGTDDARGREGKRKTNWKWVIIGLITLPIVPLGPYWLLRKGFGLPSAWVWGPMGLVAGALLMALGKSSGKLFPFALGISLLPLAAAALARYYRAPNRATWTTVGALLAAYWLAPSQVLEKLFGKLDGNIEMFVLSGIMIVIGFTLLIVFNARLLTSLFSGDADTGRRYMVPAALAVGAGAVVVVGRALGNIGDGLGQLLYLLAALVLLAAIVAFAAARFPRLAPALKMGVAYPLANRFRTGMTVAMFSLIVFSIVVMSTLTANFGAIFAGDEARGGWDVVAESNRNNPVPDLRAALQEEGSFDTSNITDIGRATAGQSVFEVQAASEVRQAGQDPKWKAYPVRAGDDAFFAASTAKLDQRAKGYASDREVFEAVRTRPNLAVVDAAAIPQGGFGGADTWTLKGVKAGDKEFAPIDVEFRDPVTGAATTVTIIGILNAKIPARIMPGIFTNESTYAKVFGAPDYRVNYLRMNPGVNTDKAAKGIKAALVTKGVQATSITKEIDTAQAQNKGFFRIFQLFMGLGLFVGIAALGVIAFRSVVERRQQIGMLRAIGYQRGTVALTFMFESSFIALMGILSGVVGAAILSRNLLTSDDFSGTSSSTSFFIPWTEVVVFVVVAYVFSLLLTWWPSRGAARVPIAEALRYE